MGAGSPIPSTATSTRSASRTSSVPTAGSRRPGSGREAAAGPDNGYSITCGGSAGGVRLPQNRLSSDLGPRKGDHQRAAFDSVLGFRSTEIPSVAVGSVFAALALVWVFALYACFRFARIVIDFQGRMTARPCRTRQRAEKSRLDRPTRRQNGCACFPIRAGQARPDELACG
jgi:hypothetical protein